MTAEPDQPPTDYPSAWKPREARERDRALDLTAAEAWLGSLSPAELQAALQRGRGGQH